MYVANTQEIKVTEKITAVEIMKVVKSITLASTINEKRTEPMPPKILPNSEAYREI